MRNQLKTRGGKKRKENKRKEEEQRREAEWLKSMRKKGEVSIENNSCRKAVKLWILHCREVGPGHGFLEGYMV